MSKNVCGQSNSNGTCIFLCLGSACAWLAAAVLDLTLRDGDGGDISARRFLLDAERLPFWCEMADIDVTAAIERCQRRWALDLTSGAPLGAACLN